jgi:hypothetical protein
MASWQQAWVEVLPDLSDFRRKANAEITPALGAAGAAGGHSFRSGFGGVLGGSFLGTLGAQFATQIAASIGQGIRAGIDFSLEGVDFASSLGEQVNAVQVAFGDMGDEILDLSENAPRNLNLTRSAFDKLAVRFSSFASTIAKRGGTSADVIRELTQRGADFASVYDIDVGEALQLFQSGLAGQSEPLRAYGIDLSEATTKAHAYTAGIAEQGAELTEAQKIQARYSSILEQTAKTEGDLANTRGSLANQQRALNVALEEAQTSFGEALLPTAVDLATFANAELIPMLNEALGEAGPVLADSLEDALPEIKELLGTLADALPDAIDVGGQLFEIATESATQDVEDLQFLLEMLNGEAEFQGLDWAKLFADGIADGFQGSSGDALADALDLLLHPLTHQETEAAEQAAKLAESYTEGFITADSWERINEPISKIGLDVAAAGENAMAELTAALASGSPAAVAEALGLKLGIEGHIKQLGVNSGPLGDQFINGLTGSLLAGRARVEAAAKDVAQRAVAAVRKTFDSHSPSRVMWREGENAIAGLIGGWESGELAPVSIPTVNLPPSGVSSAAIAGTAAAVGAATDRPIIMDGALFGVLRTMANGEATIVLNQRLDDIKTESLAGGVPL